MRNILIITSNLKDLILTVDQLLSSKGVFIFEEPYIGSMFAKTSYDQIYDEHIFMFSLNSIKKIFSLFDFDLIDAVPQFTHGGSMRYVIGSTGTTDMTAGSSSQAITVEITWDEAVTVAGSPRITVANGNQSSAGQGNYVLTYTATGSTANRKRFTLTSQSLSVTDVLTIGGSNIALNCGTISDTIVGGTTLAASLVLSGLTAVTQTIAA